MVLSTVRRDLLLDVGDKAPDATPRLANLRGTDASWGGVPMLSRFEAEADVTYSVSAGR